MNLSVYLQLASPIKSAQVNKGKNSAREKYKNLHNLRTK